MESRRSWGGREDNRSGNSVDSKRELQYECSNGYLKIRISHVDLHMKLVKIGGTSKCLLNECMLAYPISTLGCVCVLGGCTYMDTCIKKTESSVCKTEGTPVLP